MKNFEIQQFLILALVFLLVSLPQSAANAADNEAVRMPLACGSTGDVDSDDCLQATDADTQWLWLGKTNGLTCPSPPGIDWTTSRMFESSDGKYEQGLSEFCVYRSSSASPDLQALQTLLCTVPPGLPPCLTKLEADSASVAMMGSDTANLMWPQLRDFFREQVGTVGPLPGANQNVRLAVIDTEPSGFNEDRNGSGVSAHGFTLLNLVRDTICPVQGPCPVQLRSVLGLPMQPCGSDTGFCFLPLQGGINGTIGQLASAIYYEVENWRATTVNKLAINLSVAWDPLFADLDNPISNSRVAAQAAHRALQYASCRGALVIAAAGNRVTGPTLNTGALLPGGWETLNAPSPAQCDNTFGFLPDSATVGGTYRPLVYAVGAVNEWGNPIETRVGGEPRLTAYGDHAVAPVDDIVAPAPTQILTGSSIGAVVVSAAAAAAWHFDNTASLHEIMQDVYDSGMSLGRNAQFCNSGMAPCAQEVRRIGICQAVDKACSNLLTGSCPELDCDLPGTVLPGIPEGEFESLYAAVQPYSIEQNTITMAVDECRPGYVLHYGAGVPTDNPCPHLQYYGVQATPWTDGQPESQFCPTCTDIYHSPGKLYVEIDSGLEGFLTDITLLCGDDAYRVPGEWVAGDKQVISQIPENCEFEQVAVAYRLSKDPDSLVSVASPTLLLMDRDDDDVQDGLDNCLNVPNTDQLDANGDGFGNVCDGDYNDDCVVNFLDLFLLSDAFLQPDAVIDLTGDGLVNFLDVARFSELVFLPTGPSGTTVCTVPASR